MVTLLDDAFAHHVWATRRTIDACASLDPSQLETTMPGTYGSNPQTRFDISSARTLSTGTDSKAGPPGSSTRRRWSHPAQRGDAGGGPRPGRGYSPPTRSRSTRDGEGRRRHGGLVADGDPPRPGPSPRHRCHRRTEIYQPSARSGWSHPRSMSGTSRSSRAGPTRARLASSRRSRTCSRRAGSRPGSPSVRSRGGSASARAIYPRARGRHAVADVRRLGPVLQAVRVAPDVRGIAALLRRRGVVIDDGDPLVGSTRVPADVFPRHANEVIGVVVDRREALRAVEVDSARRSNRVRVP